MNPLDVLDDNTFLILSRMLAFFPDVIDYYTLIRLMSIRLPIYHFLRISCMHLLSLVSLNRIVRKRCILRKLLQSLPTAELYISVSWQFIYY